jgi:release factor glutamine methyltransferase
MEARWLLEEVTGDQHPAGQPTAPALGRFEALVERRAAGEPLQYVLGRWGFRTLDLMVDRRVLIPRPETEQVVEIALRVLDELADPHVAVDLGTGSGAIALSLAAERTGLEVWATDLSADALAVASANLAGLGGHAAARVRTALGDWWSALPHHLQGRIDLLVSNPPYVAAAEMAELDPTVTYHEPTTALEAGPTGLEAIRQILGGADSWLRPTAAVVLEIAPHQADSAATIAREAGLTDVSINQDLAGRDRALVARRQARRHPRPPPRSHCS